MNSLKDTALESNPYLRINFDGGDLSSDAGLLLIKEFAEKIGLVKLVYRLSKTNDDALFRIHIDPENLLQVMYQTMAAYFEDDCADELTVDPVFTAILGKDALASQPTLSRFYNRMDETTLKQFTEIEQSMRDIIYAIKPPEHMLFDLDSTLLNTYGHQEGEAFNYHYQAHGYHPLLKEYRTKHPSLPLYLRGDSGFAAPELYDACEDNDCKYDIRLKINSTLRSLAEDKAGDLRRATQHNMVDYAVTYGEFTYKAATWSHPRRVVFKIEKPTNQLTFMYTFIVTNMESEPYQVVKFYCGRGKMENFIKEGKDGFDFSAVSSQSKIVNANRLQMHGLAYNLFNWFRRLALAASMRKQRIDTVRLKLMKIAARVVRSARHTTFKLCSSCPYKGEFYETFRNIWGLRLQLE